MPSDSELSEKQLGTAIWYVKHRAVLRKAALGIILALDGALIVYSGWGVGQELLFSNKRKLQDLELLKTAIPGEAARLANRPVDLQLGGIELLRSGEVTDVLARVQNPNPEWSAEFSYTIGIGDELQRVENGFLLPQEERPFIRTLRSAGAGTLVFNIENLSWRRINPKEIPDVAKWRQERLDFEVQDPKFIPAVVEGKGSVGRATFSLINKTAFGYVAADFLVLLFQGSRLQGAQGVTVDEFRSGQTRKLELTWIDRLGAISNIEVVPIIDLMNPEVYLKP
ncbi:hypothetical protein HYW17_02955 [Candidatus Uhrbacteria bacterium]|nr:hypothetical protein [Candidatus Uhrbacteria bacterium]